MTIEEIIQEIGKIGYVISGSQEIGWLIRYDNGIEITVPSGTPYPAAKLIANKL